MVSTQILYLALLAYKWPPRRSPLGIVRHAFIFPLPGGEMNAWRTNPKDVCGEASRQVELKFFHEREARAVDFLWFLRQKRAREPRTWKWEAKDGRSLLRAMKGVNLSSCPLFWMQDFKMSRCVVQYVEMLNRGVHALSCIMGNQGKMAELLEDLYWNSKPANSPELKMKVQFLVGRL